MKTFIVAIFCLVASVQSAPQNSPFDALPKAEGHALESALQILTKTLSGQLQQRINEALDAHAAGKPVSKALSQPLNLDLDGPALPSRVHINATLNEVWHHGIGDIVPDIDIDLFKLSLRANYKLPEFRLQGGYSIQILSNFKPEEEESREWLVLNGDSDSEATVTFTGLELDVQAKLKWTLLGGFRVDTLDYAISPFGFEINFPNLHVLEGLVGVSNIINPVLSRMFLNEIWDIENDYHEPLVTAIRDFIDWLLKGGLIG